MVQLAPQLTPENADELLAAATHKTKFEIEQLIVHRSPRLDVPALVQPIAGTGLSTGERVPERVEQLAPGPVAPPPPRGPVSPLSPQRVALQLTMSQSTHDKLRYAQELLSHQVRSGDIAEVLDRVLDVAIGQLEIRKFAATTKPRAARTIQARCHDTRWTPVHLRQRERSALPRPQAARVRSHRRGGARRPGHGGIRLLCRAHNQNAAECAFGTEFMRHKRQEARATAAARAAANALRAAGKEKSQEVIPWLQRLGISARDARHAAALCETIPDAPIEERVRIALSCFGPRTPSRGRVGSSAGCGP